MRRGPGPAAGGAEQSAQRILEGGADLPVGQTQVCGEHSQQLPGGIRHGRVRITTVLVEKLEPDEESTEDDDSSDVTHQH